MNPRRSPASAIGAALASFRPVVALTCQRCGQPFLARPGSKYDRPACRKRASYLRLRRARIDALAYSNANA